MTLDKTEKTAIFIGFLIGLAYILMPSASAAATYDVSVVTSEITAGIKPIGTVAASSLGALAVIRVWKLIRRAV